jgi:hypothetical protein
LHHRVGLNISHPILTSHTHAAKMLRTPLTRALGAATRTSTLVRPVQTRAAHAISNPTLANIEKRWEAMPPQEQADVWMALRDRMKTNWAELTLQEKKAGMFFPFSGGWAEVSWEVFRLSLGSWEMGGRMIKSCNG